MPGSDPLEKWGYQVGYTPPPELSAARLRMAQQALNKLETYLRRPNKKTDLYAIGAADDVTPGLLPPADVARAEKLYRQLYETGGNGSTYAQDSVLSLIASSRYPASIPFWLELLDLSRPRDSFTARRRRWALAALVYLAINANHEAEIALAQAAQHANPDVRALAVYYWGRVYTDSDRKLSRAAAKVFQSIAVKDTAFGPRFQARQLLLQKKLAVPNDQPGGVYAFQVYFRRAKAVFSRTVELQAEQTLDDLHRAIQRALEWDSDHLYSFFLNNDERDDALYRFSCPYEEDRPPWTHEAVLGELGLVRRHKFLYLFDYGDSHLFEIDVVDIQGKALPKVHYPRVTDGRGEAPPQYPVYDE